MRRGETSVCRLVPSGRRRLGDPTDPDTNLGPLVRASAADWVRGQVEEAVGRIEAITPRVTRRIEGGVRVAPLERTPRNRVLWKRARSLGEELGMERRRWSNSIR